MHIAALYNINLSGAHKLALGAGYTGMGKVYFTEANDVAQNFYGLVNGRVTYSVGRHTSTKSGFSSIEIALWCNNILNKDYSLFYFDSGDAGFMQKGRGLQAGIDLRIRF